MIQNLEKSCDVLVVGGGPAGSTIAALLAARGERVTLLEKDKHPRFHIGESLLPLNLPMFDELGVRAEINRVGMLKYGIEFVSPQHEKPVFFEFASAWDKNFPYSYQVRRSEFDHILLKNAAAKGAAVIEECQVTEVDFLPEGGALVHSRDQHGGVQVWRTKFLVDASGRDTLLANKFNFKQRNRRHNSAAIYGHFTGAQRLAGKAEGNISVFWFEHGWFWFIPLSDGTTSIGAVCWPQFLKSRKTDITSFFMSAIALCPALAERLKDAKITGPATATGNYSYRSRRMIGKNYLMLGDAFAFIDPVFSTGVFLAMRSAFLGADAVSACLHEPQHAAKALQSFDRAARREIDRFSWYIYRVRKPAMRNLFMAPRNVFRVEEAILSLLAGGASHHPAIRPRLVFFKALYYLNSLLNLKPLIRAWFAQKMALARGLAE